MAYQEFSKNYYINFLLLLLLLFLICLLIITLNNYIYNTTKTNKKNTLTRDINRVQQN